MESSKEQLRRTLGLLQLERQADLDLYRQKVLMRPLHTRVKEGVTWYPVKLKADYISTGERMVIELERTSQQDKPHVFQSGKSVSVFSTASGKPEKEHQQGVINYVRENLMVITLNGDDLPDWIDHGSLGVDVLFDEMSYREMEHAVKKVMDAEGNRLAELRDILIQGNPLSVVTQQNQLDKKYLENTVLNESQKRAIQQAIQATDIAFVHGPPGTGKTTTIVQAIKQTVHTEKQVLVCAPSNAAIDLVVDKLSEQGLNVLRIGHPARVTEQSLSKTVDARITEHLNYNELRMLRKRMEQTKQLSVKYKLKASRFDKTEARLLREEVKQLKAEADMLEHYIINDLLQKCEVICCTLVGSAHSMLRGKKYQTAFIDEAGQALEPACWIPFLKAQRVIFAGDHMQLPPTVKSNEAAKLGLATTLFEKGIKNHPERSALLQTQYRMNEQIMQFPSYYFYHNQLIAHESVKNEKITASHKPIEFIDTAGAGFEEEQDIQTLSRRNKEEATILISQLEKLIEEIGLEQWLNQYLTMGIITPYRAQVDYLHHLAEHSPMLEPLHKLVTIDTVDAFQGQERDIIAISLVRSNTAGELGFLSDIRRTNVAITRAKKKLLVIGDSATLASHPFYTEWLSFLQQGEYYKSVFEV